MIPWKYIEPLWQGEDTELMVIKNTRIFIEKFEKDIKTVGDQAKAEISTYIIEIISKISNERWL